MKVLQRYTCCLLIITSPLLTACSKQGWYEGARLSNTNQCMNEPLSEYEECKQQQPAETYHEYERTRQDILKNGDQ